MFQWLEFFLEHFLRMMNYENLEACIKSTFSLSKILKWNLLNTYMQILAPVVRGRKGEYYQMLYDMLSKGYTEAIVDGEKHNLREKIVLYWGGGFFFKNPSILILKERCSTKAI